MRRLALLAAVTVAGVATGLLHRATERAEPLTPVADTPTETERAPKPTDTPAVTALPRGRVIELRAGGLLLLDGEETDLEELWHAYERRPTATCVVEDRAAWAHLEWVLGTLRGAGVDEVRFELAGGPVTVVLDAAYWLRDARRLPRGHLAGTIALGPEDVTRRDLAEHVARERDRIVAEYAWRPIGLLWPDPHAPFVAVTPALRAFADAGVELELACWGLWEERTAVPLPPVPDRMQPSVIWPRCRCLSEEFAAVELPVADMGEMDKNDDFHERVILNLDRDGRLLYRGAELNLEEFATVLRRRAEVYELKMKRQGKSAFEECPNGGKASRLIVLVRADRALPFRTVGWILHVLAEQRFWKVQFAVRRAEQPPGPCVGDFDAKLAAYLPTRHFPEIVSREGEVWPIHVHVDPDSFCFGGTRTTDPAPIGPYVREQEKEAPDWLGTVVVLHVAPAATHQQVITAVNEVARADRWKIDFAGLPPPDTGTRLAKPLPR